jgi:hypothetical protein
MWKREVRGAIIFYEGTFGGKNNIKFNVLKFS